MFIDHPCLKTQAVIALCPACYQSLHGLHSEKELMYIVEMNVHIHLIKIATATEIATEQCKHK